MESQRLPPAISTLILVEQPGAMSRLPGALPAVPQTGAESANSAALPLLPASVSHCIWSTATRPFFRHPLFRGLARSDQRACRHLGAGHVRPLLPVATARYVDGFVRRGGEAHHWHGSRRFCRGRAWLAG